MVCEIGFEIVLVACVFFCFFAPSPLFVFCRFIYNDKLGLGFVEVCKKLALD